MPLKPNFIERLLINFGIIPTVLLDSGVSLFQASALLTAGDIHLFNHLKNGPHTLEEISQKTVIGWNLFAFAGGRAYDFDVVRQWLEEAGFHSETLTHLRQAPGFSFIKAQKR